MKATTPISLVIAIVFASSVLSGSLVFFGMQLTAGEPSIPLNKLDIEIEEGLDRYIKKINEEATAQQASTQEQAGETRSQVAQRVPRPSSDDHIKGDANAPYSIIEYSDYDCPFCEKFHATAPELMTAYEGKLNWIYRTHPIEGLHPNAPYLALAAECVADIQGNDAFWDFSDRLITLGSTLDPKVRVKTAAEAIRAKSDEIIACADAGTHSDIIDKHLRDGLSSGVQGTPGVYIINNSTGQVVPGLGGADTAQYKALLASFIQ